MTDETAATGEDVATLFEHMLARLDAAEKTFGLVMMTISRFQPEGLDMLIEGLDGLAHSSRQDGSHDVEIEAYERQATAMRGFREAWLGEGTTPKASPANRLAEAAPQKPKTPH